MKIPKKIKIYGKTYAIEFRNNRGARDGVDAAASCSTWSQTIFIDNDQCIEGQEESLFHEVVEIISKESDFRWDHSTITILSNLLYQILKDNNLLKE